MKTRCLLAIMIIISILLLGCNKDKGELLDTPTNTSVSNTPSITIKPTAKPTVTVAPIPTKIPTPTVVTTPTPLPIAEHVDLNNSMTPKDYPVVDGSTATIPLSQAVYQIATGASAEDAAVAIVHTKTTQSYYNLVYGTADLLIVYEPSDEVKKFLSDNGYKLQIKPIGKDALVFMANSSNPVESLTKEQLVQIYSGKITNWSQVGGEDMELLAFQRPVNSGSQTLMLKHVMGNVPMTEGPQVQTYSEMEGILKAMAEYTNEANTLGYSVFYYAKNMYHLPELRFMKVNEVEPSLQTIYDNSYPFINEFYAVIREDEPLNSNAHKIFDWLTQEEGQQLVKDTGYVPVSLPPSKNVDEVNINPDQIPEDYVYIVETDTIAQEGINLSTVTIYQNHWEVRRIFKNVSNINDTGLVGKDTLTNISLAIHDNANEYSFRSGLYDVGEDKFLLTPKYEVLYPVDKDKLYYFTWEEDQYSVYDREGKQKISGKLAGQYMYTEEKGDYYWIYEDSLPSGISVQIYDKKFKLVRKIPYDYSNQVIYTDDGTISFSKDKFLKHFKYPVNDKKEFYIATYSDNIIIVDYDNYFWVMDYKLNVIKKHQKAGEGYYTYYQIVNDIYQEIIDGNKKEKEWNFYDLEGNRIVDEDGNSYYESAGGSYRSANKQYVYESCLYHTQDDWMDVRMNETGEIFTLKLEHSDDYYVDFLCGDYIVVKPDDKENQETRIYYQENLLCVLDRTYYVYEEQYSGGILLYENLENYNNLNYFKINPQGQITYRSAFKEKILSMDEKYIQVNRGNYSAVIDYQGNYIMKTIWDGLSDD